MTEGKASRVCLGLLCGLPASGKTTLAHQILDHCCQELPERLTALVLHYDQLIPPELQQKLIAKSAEQGSSLWKSMRSQIVLCVDNLLHRLVHSQNPRQELFKLWDSLCHQTEADRFQSEHLEKPTNVDVTLWERFVALLHHCMKRNAVTANSCDDCDGSSGWLVLIDDNMHYSSMRYEYCQIARKYEVGLCIFYISCPLEDALQRNRSRADGRVEDHVIMAMHERLEIPDTGKHPWEKYFVVVNGMASVDISPLLDMARQAIKDPLQPFPEEDVDGKAASRYVCSTNTVHQADQILRKCVSQHMAEAKDAGLHSQELKNLSGRLTVIRTTILGAMRTGEITFPFEPEENSLSNSSKDPKSQLYQCVHALFHSQINK